MPLTPATGTPEDPIYLVQLSGGVGSYAAARRLLSAGLPAERLVLMFADVLGEHPDTYRFLIEAAADLSGIPLNDVAPLARAALDLPPLSRHTLPDRKAALSELAAAAAREIPNLVWLSRGLAVWEVFEKERFIGNSRVDPCSRVLKRELLKEHITANHSSEGCRLVLGIDSTEAHRHLGAWRRWRPYEVLSPLCDEPSISKEGMHRLGEERGVERQELYRLGFEHANCSGACVKAGQGQWRRLLEAMPDVYDYHASEERRLREGLGKDVFVLCRQWRGVRRRLTLDQLREEKERAPRLVGPHQGRGPDEGRGPRLHDRNHSSDNAKEPSMAASTLPAPGTEYGPCAEPCSHTDCAHSRRMAAAVCPFCDEAIGYGRRFYNEGDPGGFDLVHALCLEDHLDGQAREKPPERGTP